MTGRLARLVNLIDRYGDAIEHDLHAHFNLDLLDFFRHKLSWRKLEVLLDRLPSGSAYWAAKMDDDEVARAIYARQKDQPKRAYAPPLQEMSLTNQLMLDLLDMQSVIAAQLKVLAGAKPGALKPMPRPTTAMVRAEREAEETYITNLVAEAKAAQARNGVE